MIDFGIITAPRDPETLNFTIKSFRKQLWAHFDIFAEPGEYHIKHSDCNIYVNKENYGAFKNFNGAINKLLNRPGDMLCVLSDDLLFSSNTKNILLQIEEKYVQGEQFGYYALFTNGTGNNAKDEIIKSGWTENRKGWHTWHGVFIMRKDIVRQIIEHPFYLNHLQSCDQQIDACIGETVKLIGLPGYVHNPSVCSTIGISTLGNIGIYDGLNFKL